jgi:hypothetical protein
MPKPDNPFGDIFKTVQQAVKQASEQSQTSPQQQGQGSAPGEGQQQQILKNRITLVGGELPGPDLSPPTIDALGNPLTKVPDLASWFPGSGGANALSAGDVVNAGTAAWTILKDTAPTVDVQSAFASAVPKGVGFQELISTVENPRHVYLRYMPIHQIGDKGLVMVDIELDVRWRYRAIHGGKLYIPNATVVPTVHDPGSAEQVTIAVKFQNPTMLMTDHGMVALIDLVITLSHNTLLVFGQPSRTATLELRADGSARGFSSI